MNQAQRDFIRWEQFVEQSMSNRTVPLMFLPINNNRFTRLDNISISATSRLRPIITRPVQTWFAAEKGRGYGNMTSSAPAIRYPFSSSMIREFD